MLLSLLNFFSTPSGFLQLAELCDGIDCFHRLWAGEHHSEDQIPAPLTVALLAAGITERIRVGTGGVALILQNPHLLAENALLAELFCPGRLDLGVTKGGAATPEVLARLLDGADVKALAADYDRKLEIVRNVLARELAAPDLFMASRVPVGPPMFSMGTTPYRAQRAGELGLGFVASFHHDNTIPEIQDMFRVYRQAFRPSPLLAAPHAIAVVSGYISADPLVLEAAIQAEAHYKPDPRYKRTVMVFDAPIPAARELRRLATAVGADEVMFLCMAAEAADCYRALAEGWRADPDADGGVTPRADRS